MKPVVCSHGAGVFCVDLGVLIAQVDDLTVVVAREVLYAVLAARCLVKYHVSA